MGKQNHQYIQPSQVGSVKRIAEFIIGCDGDLEEIYMKTDYGPANLVRFNVSKNGVSIYDTIADHFTMPAGTLGEEREATQTSFSGESSIPVLKGDKIIVTSSVITHFDRVGPKIYMQLQVEDGEAVQGPAGPTGPTGLTGPTGPTGPAGADGTNGISAFARELVVFTTGSLADGAEAEQAIPLGANADIYKVVADRACRLRMYMTDALRDADAARAIGVAPANNSGLLVEYIFTAVSLTIFNYAKVFNAETSPTNTIPSLVENLSGGTSTVQLSFTSVPLEVI